MEKGTQILYVPWHVIQEFEMIDVKNSVHLANGGVELLRRIVAHPGVEFGFVTSERGDNHFCRYWRKGQPGILRTVANSECTPSIMLLEHKSVPQERVSAILETIE